LQSSVSPYSQLLAAWLSWSIRSKPIQSAHQSFQA
jgi:hypothetical protein